MEQEATVEKEQILSNPIKIAGEPLNELPKDLYIPPQALKVFLDAFEGPLDLLLYLIRKQNIDILNIPIVQITEQYIHYIELMQELQLELAAEYLNMAATLAEIKSRLLLPKPEMLEDAEEGDPRAELIRRLQEYERFSRAAEALDERPRIGRDIFLALATSPKFDDQENLPDIKMTDLLKSLANVIERAHVSKHHKIEFETLSIRERMSIILSKLTPKEQMHFRYLYTKEEGGMGVAVSLIAILELAKQSVLEVTQDELFADIYVRGYE